MPETKRFEIKGKCILFREQRYCIHSNKVKEKQGHHEVKNPHSSRARNTHCTATIHLRLEHQRLSLIREKFIALFWDGHSPASALHVFEDELYLNTTNEQELLEILADRAYNPGYDYIAKLF
ncbi:24792_t:CDS:2 [Dentiscutata erythropus]|uniref:24792_t:CDS:1 n=1 Tax=Dentiscutata erythropus TaxID=1348616 RepID=A0A9N9NQG9_9GLOM|nr:24792_t:CDS:2 [Dentiscutata erythropus]